MIKPYNIGSTYRRCHMTSERDYEGRDSHLLNYELWDLEGYNCRGPAPDLNAPYIAYVGAAQTFGCFCTDPFPSSVSRALGVGGLNLGLAGAGPTLHQDPILLKHINGSMSAVVQVMSGRSVSNSEFTVTDGGNLGIRSHDGQRMVPLKFWTEFMRDHPDRVAALVTETRRNYVREMVKLLKAIDVPVVLLWFSVRTPEYVEGHTSVQALWGDFPQLVNREMLEEIKPHADLYLEYSSRVGLPQPLQQPIRESFLSRHYPEHGRAGLAETHNHYYPSPEMHVEVANLLRPLVASL